jgi:mRNA-degrading endonuclease RelE of RelBE toxin-antitoxin system
MASPPQFSVVFDPLVKRHLQVIDAKYHSWIRTTIHEQLTFEPEVETHNRKPLIRPIAFGATWELRLGPNNRFRVLYAVDVARHEVSILGIGIKERNRLTFAGKEMPS